MVELAVSIDGATSARFNAALEVMAKAMGATAGEAPRTAAIYICKSLQSRTKVAKQNRNITGSSPSNDRPKWVSTKDGKKLDKPLRRWHVTLNDRGKSFDKYVYGDGGRAGQRRDLRRVVGTNYYPIGYGGKGPEKKGGTRGLAKRSWGWVMHNIYSGVAPDAPWQRRKNDRRSPKDATTESTSRVNNGVTISGGYARICNRIDYIENAIAAKGATIADAIKKATNSILNVYSKKMLRKQGVSPQDIESTAAAFRAELRRQFPD